MPNVGGNALTTVYPKTGSVIDTVVLTHTGGGYFNLQPWFVQYYSSGDYKKDYRAECSFLPGWYYQKNNGDTVKVVSFPNTQPSGTLTGTWVIKNNCWLQKYTDPNGYDKANQDNDLFILRLADVYLVKAEAENELNGPTPTAYNAFNVLRDRARNANGIKRTTPSDLPSGLTKDMFRLKVFDERALELVGEGHRWFDLVRIQSPQGKTMMEYQFSTYIPTLTKGMPSYNTTSRKWGGGVIYSNALPSFQQKFLLFPIPVSELVTNPSITYQNPGY